MTIILCNGEFPVHSSALNALNNAKQIVCCDGAATKLLQYGRIPDAIVGDLDSISEELKLRFSDRLHQSTCQETNDLTKAVNYCIQKGISKVKILGATGLREDHTLGNISLLVEYASKIKVEMITDTGIFYPILESTSFKSTKGQQVSIFSITPATEITTLGLKYSVSRRSFPNWYQGTLNEAEGDNFRIEFDHGKLLIFIQHRF